MKFVIGNWKMSLNYEQSVNLAQKLVSLVKSSVNTVAVICPSTISLADVAQEIKKSPISLGAQDCFWEDKGSYTGMTSPQILADLGCQYVIIGHSERRMYLSESDEMVNKKIKKAFQIGLIPVVCVGETFEQRRNGSKDAIISQQVIKAFSGFSSNNQLPIIIAYEPVWVIGSGQAVASEEANHACTIIKQAIREVVPEKIVNDHVYTLYGGSVTKDNIKDLLSQKQIDGVLVGGASLDPEHFNSLIEAV